MKSPTITTPRNNGTEYYKVLCVKGDRVWHVATISMQTAINIHNRINNGGA